MPEACILSPQFTLSEYLDLSDLGICQKSFTQWEESGLKFLNIDRFCEINSFISTLDTNALILEQLS